MQSRPSTQRHGDSGSFTRVPHGGDWVEISEWACWHWDLRRKASWGQCWDLRSKACWGRTHNLTNKPHWAYQENTNLESGLLWLSSYNGGGSLDHGIITIYSYLQHCEITCSGNLYVQTRVSHNYVNPHLGVMIVTSHIYKVPVTWLKHNYQIWHICDMKRSVTTRQSLHHYIITLMCRALWLTFGRSMQTAVYVYIWDFS